MSDLINAETLHHAADVVGAAAGAEELGIDDVALEQFVADARWHEHAPGDPDVEVDSLSLVLGVCIGVTATKHRVQ